MDLYYFAEPFRIYNSLSIALLAVSIAILGLMIPYINRLRNNYSLQEVALEKEKKKLKVTEIVEKYSEINDKIGNLNTLKSFLVGSIIFYVLVIFFSAWFLNSGSYNCLNL